MRGGARQRARERRKRRKRIEDEGEVEGEALAPRGLRGRGRPTAVPRPARRDSAFRPISQPTRRRPDQRDLPRPSSPSSSSSSSILHRPCLGPAARTDVGKPRDGPARAERPKGSSRKLCAAEWTSFRRRRRSGFLALLARHALCRICQTHRACWKLYGTRYASIQYFVVWTNIRGGTNRVD